MCVASEGACDGTKDTQVGEEYHGKVMHRMQKHVKVVEQIMSNVVNRRAKSARLHRTHLEAVHERTAEYITMTRLTNASEALAAK